MSAVLDLYADQGAQYDTVLSFVDLSGAILPLTGWTATATVEAQLGGAALFTISSPASGIVINASAGTIALTFTSTQTLQMVLSQYLWRLDTIDATAIPRRYLRGTVHVAGR